MEYWGIEDILSTLITMIFGQCIEIVNEFPMGGGSAETVFPVGLTTSNKLRQVSYQQKANRSQITTYWNIKMTVRKRLPFAP